MGMFILPARLKRQFTLIDDAFTNNKDLKNLLKENEDLKVHEQLIKHLEEVKKNSIEKVNYHEEITKYVNEVCRNILLNTAVFKNDKDSQQALNTMLRNIKY